MAAGDNERNFRNVMAAKFGTSVLAGKKRYKDPIEKADSAEISVDDSILLPDGRLVLIEVDSANMAKLIAGQYALLNGLYTGDFDKTLFLTIHYFANYEASRTIKNLKFIQGLAPSRKWLPYAAFHISDFGQMIEKASGIADLIDSLWPKLAATAKKPSSTAHIKIPALT
ncbi:hypothetical protein SDC9_181893 [bioreactor metagenome]|uniref:Uncharacterized protein n=1 Tax=bioreactor metagenome TaxID=1076179 RepID=A0A645H6R5_9ZZZZ